MPSIANALYHTTTRIMGDIELLVIIDGNVDSQEGSNPLRVQTWGTNHGFWNPI